ERLGHEDEAHIARRAGRLVRQLPAGDEHERREHCGEHDERQADAVDAERPARADLRDPRIGLRELDAARGGQVEADEQRDDACELEDRHPERELAGAGAQARDREQQEAAERRQRDEDGQQWHGHRTPSSAMAVTMTTPRNMSRAYERTLPVDVLRRASPSLEMPAAFALTAPSTTAASAYTRVRVR